MTQDYIGEERDNVREEDLMAFEHEKFLNDLSGELKRDNIVETNINNDDDEHDLAQEGAKNPIHNPKTHWKIMKPIRGERYESPTQLKECITNYALANGYQIWFERNDHTKLLARCGKESDDQPKCPWRLWATWMKNERSFQVKALVDEHLCARKFTFGSLMNYKFIGKKFANRLRENPDMKLVDLQSAVFKKYKCLVSFNQCARARTHAISEFEQGMKKHYDKLWEYGEEIRRTNPGSTVKMSVEVNPDGKTYFQGFYICLQGLKEGWISGCRRVIGLDGCFLKTICKGELLSAVGRDGNNQIFPIAWAVVNIENKENWTWFIDLLKDGLSLIDGAGTTLISDQHKGLIEAVKAILPLAEHRQCARHIYANFRKKFSGVEFKNLFWAASKASYEQQFEEVMAETKVANFDAYLYLMEKAPHTWSRAFFETNRACDAVENGISECFNSLLVNARRKPILTLLEAIRVIMIERMDRMRERAAKWVDDICPAIRKKLEHLKEQQRFWHVLSCGGDLFEVKSGLDAFIVDIDDRSCSCRTWQLSGLPCAHAMAAILYVNKIPETYVPDCFRKTMFLQAYNHYLKPLNGIKMWPKTNHISPLPPLPRRMPGRPKVKRRRDAVERLLTSRGQIGREGRTMTCTKCNETGHNSRSCKNEKKDAPLKEVRPPGRPKTNFGRQSSEGCTQKDAKKDSSQVKSRPKLIPKKRRSSEGINLNKLQKNTVEKDGEGRSCDKVVQLD